MPNFTRMPKARFLDLVLLEASIFGVNQGYTGKYIGPRSAWTLGILNFCYSLTLSYLVITGKNSTDLCANVVNCVVNLIFFDAAVLVTLFIQLRCLFRRSKMESVYRELARLDQSSTWGGDICGTVGRILLHVVAATLHQSASSYRSDWEGFRGLMIAFYWLNFVPTAAMEFLGQAMLLFRHELKELRHILRGYTARRRGCGVAELRRLNRRHASLFAISHRVAEFTGLDSMIMIETETLLILANLFLKVNSISLNSTDWRKEFYDVVLNIYRVERITQYCVKGYKIQVEADRFAAAIDEIDPLDFEKDESFTEFQIFRRQVRLRMLRFDCHRFLKLDANLIIRKLKYVIAVVLILVQFTNPVENRVSSETANATEAVNLTLKVLDHI